MDRTGEADDTRHRSSLSRRRGDLLFWRRMFELEAPFAPAGDQPEAIARLTERLQNGGRHQTLLGVTGSGKTFTVANVLKNLNRPTLVLSHNKTLAAQLYAEFKGFFPATRSSISSATSIITSPRPISRARTPTSRRTRA